MPDRLEYEKVFFCFAVLKKSLSIAVFGIVLCVLSAISLFLALGFLTKAWDRIWINEITRSALSSCWPGDTNSVIQSAMGGSISTDEIVSRCDEHPYQVRSRNFLLRQQP